MVSLFGKKPRSPEDVFTPRRADVNPEMYVARPELEERLKQVLHQNYHLLIHGESGSGKSWLYKRVLEDVGAIYYVGNLANAARLGSITAELKNITDREAGPEKVGYFEKTHASADALFAKGGLEHQTTYVVPQKEPFERLCEVVRMRAKARRAVLVLDNLETIRDNEVLMSELANIIILLDDETYSKYDIKIMLVGVPADVRAYFNTTPSRQTVANRLLELPEVSRLTDGQTAELVRRGFIGQLVFVMDENLLSEISSHVGWVTDRIPQRLHEYCLELAYLGISKGRRLELSDLNHADARWLSTSLSNSYGVVESLMNERETKIGRRNQVLFALGRTKETEIRYVEIEKIVREYFSQSTNNKTLNISGMLTELASGGSPLLKRSPKGDSYVFVDPKYRMCLRAMLSIGTNGERVIKRTVQQTGEGVTLVPDIIENEDA